MIWRENIEYVRVRAWSERDREIIDSLTAQIEELERERDVYMHIAKKLGDRAETAEQRCSELWTQAHRAEQRVAELEAALREIRVACDPVVHGGSFNENGARRRLTDIEALAHVALVGELLRSQSDPPASG